MREEGLLGSFEVKNPLASPARLRKATSAVAAVVVCIVIAVVVVQAARAEGRHSTRATFNDGGAWLLNEDIGRGVVGHLNLVVEEFSGYVDLEGRMLSSMSVLQSPGLVAIPRRAC